MRVKYQLIPRDDVCSSVECQHGLSAWGVSVAARLPFTMQQREGRRGVSGAMNGKPGYRSDIMSTSPSSAFSIPMAVYVSGSFEENVLCLYLSA